MVLTTPFLTPLHTERHVRHTENWTAVHASASLSLDHAHRFQPATPGVIRGVSVWSTHQIGEQTRCSFLHIDASDVHMRVQLAELLDVILRDQTGGGLDPVVRRLWTRLALSRAHASAIQTEKEFVLRRPGPGAPGFLLRSRR